jgi:transcriptional regulator
MYIPGKFAEDDLPTLHAFLEAHPLAAIVTHSESAGLYATHVPLVLDRTAGSLGTLLGHFARANPHVHLLAEGGTAALIMFTGPDAYITPAWYQTKRETAKVVPTWNYVAVHAYGALRLHDDPAFLRRHLEALTTRHESKRERPWKVSDAPEDFIEQQMKAIVAVEFTIERLEGKWKMSQNRVSADVDGVIRGLGASTEERDHSVAALVAERRPNAGGKS